jgi:hypothetical protein
MGPCLCGDPCCASCGSPAAEAYAGELEHLSESVDELKPSAGELELARLVAVEAIKAARACKLQEQIELADLWETPWGLLARITDVAASGVAFRKQHGDENLMGLEAEWVQEARDYLARHPDAAKGGA